jgi:hypothetical protein
MLAVMHRVIDTTAGAPGLIEFKACRELSQGVLAGYSRWDSEADFQAALATITSLGPERKPDGRTGPTRLSCSRCPEAG